MERTEFDKLKEQIINEYEERKTDIAKEIEYSLMHWHTPKCGLRTREELESFQSYRELIESKNLLGANRIDPYKDFSWKDGKTLVHNLWFYKRWNLLGSSSMKSSQTDYEKEKYGKNADL